MRARLWLLIGLSTVLVFGLVATAHAGIRFKRVTASVVDGAAPARTVAASANSVSPELRISWLATGAGRSDLLEYLVTADVSVVYACINSGGHHPPASNKITRTGHVTASGTAVTDARGKVEGTLTTQGSLPDPGSFRCPRGQELVTAEVLYSSILLTDVTNGVSAGAPDASKAYFVV